VREFNYFLCKDESDSWMRKNGNDFEYFVSM
jgi:hypothetical protein